MAVATRLLGRFLVWRDKHLGHRQFVYILSFIIGILSGLAAVLLKNISHSIEHFLLHRLPADKMSFLYLFFPVIGIFLTVIFIKYFVKDNIGHGVSKILYAISKKGGKLKSHNNYTSMIAGTLTVGFGGSVGLEAPIVLTGASIGSTFGRLFRMNYRSTTTLVGCGAAGALAAIFKAPIAAIVFSLEVLMLDLTMWSLIPLMISAVTALTISYFFLGKDVMFHFYLTEQFALGKIPFYIILGIFCGMISFYFTRVNTKVEGVLMAIKNPYTRLLAGGATLGITVLFLPPLYGEGYNTLSSLLSGNPAEITNNSLFYSMNNNVFVFAAFLALIIIFKVVATAATNGGGGVGGIFAPALFLGGISGYFFAKIVNVMGVATLSERNFSLVGMAGMMAGIMHAPLTAIFLIAEITGGYGLLLPLIITSTIAFITIVYFEPHSIYTLHLAQRGELITHHKDKAVLTLIEMGKVIEKDFITLKPTDTLADLVHAISQSKRNIFPVVTDDEMLVGIVLLDDIRHIIFNTDIYNTTSVHDLMMLPPSYVSPDEPMDEVMQKFEDTGSWNLPVLNNGKYVGFLSKSKIFSVYRKWLLDISGE